MDDAFLSVITARHCKRAFLDRPVPREVLERILSTAGHAPSTRNTQMWRVDVLEGTARESLAQRLLADFDARRPSRAEYASRPKPLQEVFERRGRTADDGRLTAWGVDPGDKVGARAATRRNFHFYDAPIAMIFHLPSDAVAGTFLEMGMFLQNVMLGLVACGLGGCPQGSVTAYADTIREHLELGPERLIVCGMSVGYPDESAPVNSFAPQRIAVGEYTRWHSQPPLTPVVIA